MSLLKPNMSRDAGRTDEPIIVGVTSNVNLRGHNFSGEFNYTNAGRRPHSNFADCDLTNSTMHEDAVLSMPRNTIVVGANLTGVEWLTRVSEGDLYGRPSHVYYDETTVFPAGFQLTHRFTRLANVGDHSVETVRALIAIEEDRAEKEDGILPFALGIVIFVASVTALVAGSNLLALAAQV